MARILFLDRDRAYVPEATATSPLGGIQSCVVSLSQAFAGRGHKVTVLAAIARPADHEGVAWARWESRAGLPPMDLTISINDPAALELSPPSRHKIVWWHNRLGLWRLFRRRQLGAIFRQAPEAVFLSEDQAGKAPKMLPFTRRLTLHHGIGEAFLAHRRPRPPGPPVAVFASQPYRGLDFVLDLWRRQIHPAVPAARLKIFAPKIGQIGSAQALAEAGVEIGGSVSHRDLAAAVAGARVMLVPGHRDETFCNVAAEAIACGTPVVTRGIAALAERVRHDQTGAVAPDPLGFAQAVLALLTDDALWIQRHHACLTDPAIDSWQIRARAWEQYFLDGPAVAGEPVSTIPPVTAREGDLPWR